MNNDLIMATKVINSECHPSETDWFVRLYLETDGSWDVDVYEKDERDNELSRSHFWRLDEAIQYTKTVVETLQVKGSLAITTVDELMDNIVSPTGIPQHEYAL